MSKSVLLTFKTFRSSTRYLIVGALLVGILFALDPDILFDAELLAIRVRVQYSKPADEYDFVKLWSEQNEDNMIALALGEENTERMIRKGSSIGYLSSGETYSLKNYDGEAIRVSGILLDLSKRDIPFFRLNINIKTEKTDGQYRICEVSLAPTCDRVKLKTFLKQSNEANSEIRNKNFESLKTLKRALDLESINKTDSAKSLLKRESNSNPSFWPTLVRLGYLNSSYGILSQVLKIRPDYSRAYVFRSNASRAFDKPENIADFQKALELEPDNVRAWCEIAILRDDPEQSLKDLKTAMKLNQNDLIALAEKSSCNERLGKLKEALQDRDSLVALKPDWYDAHFRRGKLKREMNNPEGALQDVNSAIEKFNSEGREFYLIQMLYARASVYRDLGEYDKAIVDFDKIATMDKRSDASLAKAEILFDIGRVREAKRVWMEINENNLAHGSIGAVVLPVGGLVGEPVSFFDTENTSKRNRDRYAEAVKKRLKSAEGYHKRALARQSGGDVKGAMLDINEAIKLEPKNPELYLARCNILPNSTGALDDIEIAIKLDPQNPLLYDRRANFRRRIKDTKGSLDDENLARKLCKKKYSMKEILENPYLHQIYYGFHKPSGEYDCYSSIMYPSIHSQHWEKF